MRIIYRGKGNGDFNEKKNLKCYLYFKYIIQNFINIWRETIMETLHINEVDLFSEPRLQILPKLTKILNEPEMSIFESAFLCGLLKKYKPHKIVEVGIAGGGTTAIILQCMEMLHIENWVIHSIDYSERFYMDSNYQSGFLADEAKKFLGKNANQNHYFHFGNVASSFMEEIGKDVDFLIIDTMHILPGEVLDFISLLPWLDQNAVVVLHDIARNQYAPLVHSNCFATGELFSSVVAEKYINYDASRNELYPNIGAFIVNENTKKYIENVFLSLFLTWSYQPEEKQIAEYRNVIKKYYRKELVDLFELSIRINTKKRTFKERIVRAAYAIIRGR